MKLRGYFFIILLLALILSAIWWFYFREGQASFFEKKDILARINDEMISTEEFKQKIELIIRSTDLPYKNKNFDRIKFKKAFIQKMIQNKLIQIEIEKNNIKIDKALLQEQIESAFLPFAEYNSGLILFQNNITKEVWQELYQESLNKQIFLNYLKRNISVTNEEIQKYYKNNPKKITTPRQHEIQHIHVNSLDVANFLSDRIKKGADFTALAKQYSISEEKGFEGNIGYFVTENTLPKIFDEAIFKLTYKNATTKVLKTSFGYHFFQLKQIINSQTLSLEEARTKIIAMIHQEKISNIFEEWFKNVLKTSNIFINYKLLEDERTI